MPLKWKSVAFRARGTVAPGVARRSLVTAWRKMKHVIHGYHYMSSAAFRLILAPSRCGAGKHSSCVPTFGATRSVTRMIPADEQLG
jgi:hypothetical protein